MALCPLHDPLLIYTRCITLYGLVFMPTKKRRLIISLPQELDEALVRFSKVTGQPQSSFVLSCLMENLEALKLLTEAVEQAKAGNVSQYEALIAQALGTTLLKIGNTSDNE